MGRRLASFVHVMDEHQQAHVFGPDDDLPKWAVDRITNPKAWADDASDGPPPKSGKGSGVDAWKAYAAAQDVAVDDDATRDDVIAALEAAGVATEPDSDA